MKWATKRKNEINKGKICKGEGCTFNAKAKGYCYYCYMNNRIKDIDIEHITPVDALLKLNELKKMMEE